MESQKK